MSNTKTISNPDNLQILYEDNHLIAVNKRVGDIVQGDKTGDIPLSEIIKQYLKVKYNKLGNVYLGVIHRLDRPTSGLVIFAKTSKALSRLNEAFKNRNTQKYYRTIVAKKDIPKTGYLVHYLVKNPKNNTSKAHIKEVHNSKKAELKYKIISEIDNYMLLEIELLSGRHHQIRAQLSTIGLPIKGDLKYGFARSNKDAGINLHSHKLIFEHPTTKDLITIVAEPPENNGWEFFK